MQPKRFGEVEAEEVIVLKLSGARDGKAVALPEGLDAICIETPNGTIYLDLGEPIPDMVLMRTSIRDGGTSRLIFSPMDGRIAVGVIKTTR